MSHEARPRRTQQQRREETRQRVLDAALKTLMIRGYAGTSTWAICETGGFSKGTLLYHFPHRQGIFEALMADLSTRSLDSLATSIASAPDIRKRQIFLDWLWSTLEGDFFALGLEILTAARTEPELRAVVREGSDALIQLIDDVIEDLIADTPDARKAIVRDALQVSVHLVRGIGLDLVVGGNRKQHEERFHSWSEVVVNL